MFKVMVGVSVMSKVMVGVSVMSKVMGDRLRGASHVQGDGIRV